MNDYDTRNQDGHDVETHLEAIDHLGFIHEHLPTGHSGNGSWFVHRSDRSNETPQIRVIISLDATEIHTFYGDHTEMLWSAKFAPSTPANVINQAVAAAQQN